MFPNDRPQTLAIDRDGSQMRPANDVTPADNTNARAEPCARGYPCVVDLDALAERIAHKLALRLRGPEPWLTKRELSDLLRVTTAQVDRLVREGMPRFYVGTQSPRFDLDACRRWLERRAIGNAAPPLPLAASPAHGAADASFIPEIKVLGVRRISRERKS